MEDEAQVTTTIVLEVGCWQLLKRLAALRAAEAGGRPSASRVIGELVKAEAKKEGMRA